MTHDGDVLKSGVQFDEFEIRQVLGRPGGFGVTYLAHDRSLGRRVAIKEYRPDGWSARRPDGGVGPRSAAHAKDYAWGLTRFWDEARILANLDHADIVRVHRVFKARGTAYMVMEYIEGQSLEAELKVTGPWPEPRVRALLAALVAGLAAVHAQKLVHRDIKPSNIMLRPNGTPVLIDFGAARLAVGGRSQSLSSLVTAGYAPFEQYFEKGRQGPWSDIYALGAVAYRALSGEVPNEATERMEDDRLRPVAEVARHPVSAELSAAITAALAVRGEDRPQSLAAWQGLFPEGRRARRPRPRG